MPKAPVKRWSGNQLRFKWVAVPRRVSPSRDTPEMLAAVARLERLVGSPSGGSRLDLLQAAAAALEKRCATCQKKLAEKTWEEMGEEEKEKVEGVMGDLYPNMGWDELGEADKVEVVEKVEG
ncbi:hypothetical protein MMC14_002801 [Varicellaria rhodocarpa]|nr:hypothetical protein [Varicellaria rhodocarpa]